MCFGETLVSFDFDEKHAKLWTNNYVISLVKKLSLLALCLHFAVDQELSVLRYNFENGIMSCKQKY